MIKIAIAGITGRMGRSLYQALEETTFDMGLSVATVLPDDVAVGQPVSAVLGGRSTVSISDQLTKDFDLLIDFTSVKSTLAHVDFCQAHHKAIVIGTTGLSDTELTTIRKKAQTIPLFMSANMSIGINVLQQLVTTATQLLYQRADIEIVEAHHKNKVDAPSGTALMLGQSVAKAACIDLSDKAVYAREGITGAREDGSIGFSTIRGGDVVGEHSVNYYMAGEHIEVSHRATNRQVFANGALFAANYLATQSPGLYNMFDALGLEKPNDTVIR